MPIYEFYCEHCHTIYSFLSQKVDTATRPNCPKCKRRKLARQVSLFAMTGRAKEPGGEADDLPVDESKMEKAIEALAGEVDNINEDDPRQAAQLMRKFASATGMELGAGMQEALGRMEQGEDPEAIEQEMGDLLENEEPFLMPGAKGGKVARRAAPARDETLYEM